VGETPQLFPVLFGLWRFHFLRGELPMARELAEQVFRLARSIPDPAFLVWPHAALGLTLCHLGELTPALTHLGQGIALYDPQKHRPDRLQVSGQDPKVTCLSYAARILWHLGYPAQARQRIEEALTLAQELSHPFSSAFALNFAAALHQLLREVPAVQKKTAAVLALAREQGFPFWVAWGTIQQGWAVAEQGQVQEGITQMSQGLATVRATGAELNRAYGLAWLATAYRKRGQIEEGLTVLAEGLEVVQKTSDCFYAVELHRLKGELLLQSSAPESRAEAEQCFHKAVKIARKQQAKSLELRAVMSLSRLWNHQGKTAEAHQLLAEIYGWFTEGFDTKDLQEAQALLDELAEGQ
jgi:predicted ATPase